MAMVFNDFAKTVELLFADPHSCCPKISLLQLDSTECSRQMPPLGKKNSIRSAHALLYCVNPSPI